MFVEQPCLWDDDTYMMIQIYSHQSSNSIGIQVHQVSLEMFVPSGYCLKGQWKRARKDKVLQVKVLKKIAALVHREKLLQQQVVHQERVLGLQVPAPSKSKTTSGISYSFDIIIMQLC